MRDLMLKYNLIKASKAIIDIGTNSSKMLEADYTSKLILIEDAHFLKIKYNGEKSFEELAKKVESLLHDRKKRDIIVALPSSLTENKIISIKNKSRREAIRMARKQCRDFARTNPLTHVVEPTLMGTREEQGDTVTYFLIASVHKSTIDELMSAFHAERLRITRIVSCGYNQACLSEVFADEFDNINRILVDFGNTESRIMVFADKVAVYTRTIPIGFQSYVKKLFDESNTATKKEIVSALVNIGEVDVDEETAKEKLFNIGKSFYYESISEINKQFFKEFARILDMCSNSDIEISKVYVSGYTHKGFLESFTNSTEIDCEVINFENGEVKAGHGKTIIIETETPISSRFANSVGISFCPLF